MTITKSDLSGLLLKDTVWGFLLVAGAQQVEEGIGPWRAGTVRLQVAACSPWHPKIRSRPLSAARQRWGEGIDTEKQGVPSPV